MTESNAINRFTKGMKRRREIMGDAYVERAESTKNTFDQPYQQLITEAAWGHVWARDDIKPRERLSLIHI